MTTPVTLTTGEIAAHCSVTYATVHNWIKGGKLKAHSTPGRHKRVLLSDFQEFLRHYGMPMFRETAIAGLRVLIVDDDPAVVKTIEGMVTRGGHYEIVTASDGFDAGIKLLGFQPQVVVLDLMMPQLDGFEVCRRIKSTEKLSKTVVIAITADPTDEMISRAFQAGADEFLPKPFKMRELTRLIDESTENIGAASAIAG